MIMCKYILDPFSLLGFHRGRELTFISPDPIKIMINPRGSFVAISNFYSAKIDFRDSRAIFAE